MDPAFSGVWSHKDWAKMLKDMATVPPRADSMKSRLEELSEKVRRSGIVGGNVIIINCFNFITGCGSN